MTWLFSKRCKQGLADKIVEVHLSVPVRNRICNLLDRFDSSVMTEFHDEFGDLQSPTLRALLPGRLEAELGLTELYYYAVGGQSTTEPGTVDQYIRRGTYPPHVLDILELAHLEISEKDRAAFQWAVNEVMEEEGCCWRMANGRIFPVQSAYIEEEVVRRSTQLLQQEEFHGALEEFEDARTKLANGDYKGSIRSANLAVESVIKQVLGKDKARPGVLYHELARSGIVPEYLGGFLKAFEEHLVRCPATIRNQEPGAGHGRGQSTRQVPRELAEFAVNVTAALIKFLVDRWLDSQVGQPSDVIASEDLPFE